MCHTSEFPASALCGVQFPREGLRRTTGTSQEASGWVDCKGSNGLCRVTLRFTLTFSPRFHVPDLTFLTSFSEYLGHKTAPVVSVDVTAQGWHITSKRASFMEWKLPNTKEHAAESPWPSVFGSVRITLAGSASLGPRRAGEDQRHRPGLGPRRRTAPSLCVNLRASPTSPSLEPPHSLAFLLDSGSLWATPVVYYKQGRLSAVYRLVEGPWGLGTSAGQAEARAPGAIALCSAREKPEGRGCCSFLRGKATVRNGAASRRPAGVCPWLHPVSRARPVSERALVHARVLPDLPGVSNSSRTCTNRVNREAFWGS